MLQTPEAPLEAGASDGAKSCRQTREGLRALDTLTYALETTDIEENNSSINISDAF